MFELYIQVERETLTQYLSQDLFTTYTSVISQEFTKIKFSDRNALAAMILTPIYLLVLYRGSNIKH